MGISEEIQSHQIPSWSRVVLESPKGQMRRQYLNGIARQNSFHIVHKVKIGNQHIELERILGHIDCSATRIFMTPQLLNRLGLPHNAVHITAHCCDGQYIAHLRERVTCPTGSNISIVYPWPTKQWCWWSECRHPIMYWDYNGAKLASRRWTGQPANYLH
jgi:hypothetical protein